MNPWEEIKNSVIHPRISYKTIGILFSVYNELGYGYYEKHYERAVEKYLIKEVMKYKRQMPYKIRSRGGKLLEFII